MLDYICYLQKHLIIFCISDVLQQGADGLGQAAEASAGVHRRHARHPGWVNQDHPVQKPSCRRLLWVVTGSSHRHLSGNKKALLSFSLKFGHFLLTQISTSVVQRC